MIGAIHLANVLNDLLTTFILEVAVDIGHLNAFRGKESLEQQAVGKRLQVGDTHSVCNDRTSSGTTARPNTDALASRPVQVFLHDQEVRRKALLDDDAHLVFGTIERLFGNRVAVALLHAFEHLMAEPALVRLASGSGNFGRMESRSRMTLHFSATSTVVSHASGKSRSASRISSSVFI